MKFQQASLTLCATLALGLASCSNNESATATADDATKATGSNADALTTTSETTRVEAAKTAEAGRAPDNGKAQELIDKASSLVAESKFSDASSVLEQLTGQSISGEQTKLVDGLKEQIQKALVAKTTETAPDIGGNLLKK
jgi:hypothetical protein